MNSPFTEEPQLLTNEDPPFVENVKKDKKVSFSETTSTTLPPPMESEEAQELDAETDVEEEYDESVDVDEYEPKDISYDKWKYSIISGLIFFIIANPLTYKFMNLFLKKIIKVTNKNGSPSFYGLLLHTIVYVIIIRGTMDLNI